MKTSELVSKKVISIGLNMKCNKCITTGIIGHNEDGYYVSSGGIRMKIDEYKLDEFLLDTPENRKLLKSQL